MIPSIIITPSCAALFPIIVHNVDPTYFWFRNILLFSTHSKLAVIIRMVIIFLTLRHGCVLVNATVITYVNIGLMVNSYLKQLTKRDEVHNFAKKLHKYRQLQIIMIITNHTIQDIMAAGLLTFFICFVIVGYIVVRLSNVFPTAMILLCIIFILFFVIFVHSILPLAIGGIARSEEFIRDWEVQNLPKVERKELKSCNILRHRVGPYTTLTKGFRTNFFSFVLYHTVNLIIVL